MEAVDDLEDFESLKDVDDSDLGVMADLARDASELVTEEKRCRIEDEDYKLMMIDTINRIVKLLEKLTDK